MANCWRIGVFGMLGLLLLLCGCTTGGNVDVPKTLTSNQLIDRGQTELESVATNPYMSQTNADRILRAAEVDFNTALQKDQKNTQAKMGLALACTFQGVFDLGVVLPSNMGQMLVNLLTQKQSTTSSPMGLPARMLQAGMKARAAKTRNSLQQSMQLQIASTTLPNLSQVLPLFADVENDVRNGAKLQLRMYINGQIRLVKFDVADVQLTSAFGNLVASLLNLAVCYNLDMPDGTPVRQLPIDSNSNNMLEAEEYLIAAPFLNRLVYTSSIGPSGCLLYLHNAAVEAQAGSTLSGHTIGVNALIDVTDSTVQQNLNKLAGYAGLAAQAAQSQVPIGDVMGDGVSRTLNLPNLLYISSLRSLMPTFPKDDDTATGIWPDPTFHGIITPGIPQGSLTFTYQQLRLAFK